LAFSKQFQLAKGLPNISGWLANPEHSDARHKSGQLSLVYLALRSPLGPKFLPDALRLALTGMKVPGLSHDRPPITPPGSHVRNILREPLSTGRFMVGYGTKRLLARRPRAPSFALYSERNTYPLQFYSEHLPSWSSYVSLSRDVDDLGRQRLDLSLRFSGADVTGIVRSHQYWDAYLRDSGVGALEYLRSDTYEAVERQLGGGLHQIGTTRMSATPAGGVVDRDLAVHGTENVYVASSSTFVTSSQANPTLTTVAFAVRLADHLRGKLRHA